MNDCVNGAMRDALPDLIHGRLSDSDRAAVTAHVESCVDCCAEVELLREARASAPAAPPMNAGRIAANIDAYVPRRDSDIIALIHESPGPGRRSNWKLAAAALFIVVGAAVLWQLDFGRSPEASQAVASATAESPRATNVQPGPAASETPRAITVEVAPALSLIAGLQELGDAELETLLSELDRMESLPSAEPHPVTIAAEDIEGER